MAPYHSKRLYSFIEPAALGQSVGSCDVLRQMPELHAACCLDALCPVFLLFLLLFLFFLLFLLLFLVLLLLLLLLPSLFSLTPGED